MWNDIPENQFTFNIIFTVGYFLNFFFIFHLFELLYLSIKVKYKPNINEFASNVRKKITSRKLIKLIN